MRDKVKGVKADMLSAWTSSEYHKSIKRQKNRIERRRAKSNPECIPGYRLYRGWES